MSEPPRRHHHHHHHSRSKKKKSREPSLDALPQAVKERIAAFLRPAELCALGQTSRGWRALCGGDALWRTLYAAEFHVAGALPERPAPPNDRWRDAFARQRALFAHIDACRRAARPRQGWTEHEALLREAVALRHDDVLTHVFATIGRKGGDAALLRAVTRALAVASAAPVAAPTMVARIAALFPNSPGFRDEQGNTALHCASTREIALLLQKAGASAAAVNDAGAYPIHTAAAAGNAEVVRCLLDSESIALRTATGDTPLTIACFNGALPVVRLLANVGADLRAANANGMLPLHCAAVGNHIEVVRFLLSKGCNPAAADDHGNTPMDLCAARGHLDLIEVFLGALKSAQPECILSPKCAHVVFSFSLSELITVEQISSLTLTRLGSGAFGDVFKASLGGRQVALKRVRTKSLMDAGKTAEWIRQKFLLEVALAKCAEEKICCFSSLSLFLRLNRTRQQQAECKPQLCQPCCCVRYAAKRLLDGSGVCGGRKYLRAGSRCYALGQSALRERNCKRYCRWDGVRFFLLLSLSLFCLGHLPLTNTDAAFQSLARTGPADHPPRPHLGKRASRL